MGTATTARRAAPLPAEGLPKRLLGTGWTFAALAMVAVGRLAFVGRPTSPDEGGYLLVGSQWHAGSSVYGDYWLARPPLLVGVNELAAALGGTLALRAIGLLAVVGSVLIAAAISRHATRAPGATASTPSTPSQVAPVAAVALFMTTPLFGTTHVDGELLAAPFVLGGVLAFLRASAARGPKVAVAWALAAGAAATSAAMVKQNSIDVFVFVAACLVVLLARGERRPVPRLAAAFATGALTAAAVILGIATLRGTSLGDLWDSVVTFRLQAAAVISSSAPDVNAVRLRTLVLAAVVSLAPAVVAVLGWQTRRGLTSREAGSSGPLDLRWPAYALLVWEVVSVAGGGSYWLHYLLDLVPGIAVLAVAAAQRRPSGRGVLTWALAAAALSTGIATCVDAVKGPDYSSDRGTISYLRQHARVGDTAVVAFGHPNILWDAGLASPYEQLWSLPVRVRDPDLSELGSLLASAKAPTWVVVAGSGLDSWGIDAGHADRVLEADYHRVADESPYVVWHVNGSGR